MNVLRRRARGMVGSAIALMVATVISSGLGLVYWIVAAQLYSAEAVGRASAQVSAAMAAVALGQLNLPSVYARFLGVAGDRARSFLARGYAVSCLLVVAFALIIAFSGLGSAFIPAGVAAGLLFAALAVCLHLASLQDSILAGMRHAPVVLVAAVTVSVAKVILLVAMGRHLIPGSIILSWWVPLVIVVAATAGWIFSRGLPRFMQEHSDSSRLPSGPQLRSFVVAEYAKSLLMMLPITVLPLLVVSVVGQRQTAFFTVPWLFNSALITLSWNTSVALVVESVTARRLTYAAWRRFLILMATLCIGACIGMFVMARPVLMLQGPEYVAGSLGVFHLLALGMPCAALVTVYSTLLWLNRRLWSIVAIQVLSAALLFGLGLPLLRAEGITGLAQAYLIAQGVLAVIFVVPVVRRTLQLRRVGSVEIDGESGEAVPTAAVALGAPS